jgi:hypothetical protein
LFAKFRKLQRKSFQGLNVIKVFTDVIHKFLRL